MMLLCASCQSVGLQNPSGPGAGSGCGRGRLRWGVVTQEGGVVGHGLSSCVMRSGSGKGDFVDQVKLGTSEIQI